MSQLVRARVKAIEQFPDWARCCAELLQYADEHKERIFTLDLETLHEVSVAYCKFCGNEVDGKIAGPSICFKNSRANGTLALFDLDEVPPELQSDKYVDAETVQP